MGTVDDLMKVLKTVPNITEDDLELIQEHLEDGEYDILSIKEDMSDREQSMLVDFFRDDTQYGEELYDVVYSIVHGKYKAPKDEKSETTKEEKDSLADSHIFTLDDVQTEYFKKKGTMPNSAL